MDRIQARNGQEEQVRVMVVDDSAFSRRTITKILESHRAIKVVGVAENGKEALRQIERLKPDLITLDLQMPEMDGFTFLRVLMKINPIPVIVVSTRDGEKDVFKAMDLGAVDFIPKPTKKISYRLFDIREQLLEKVLTAKGVRPRSIENIQPIRTEESPPIDACRIETIAIGASTGGPSAIQWVLSQIGYIPSAILISQHMPPGFTRAFAERLDKECPMEVREAREGDLVRPGRVLLAPGGHHLAFRKVGRDVVVRLIRGSTKDRYVPSIDIMFESAASIWKDRLMGIVLTGMGSDGARGAKRIKEEGGLLIAESQKTALIFSMPEAVISEGLADEVLPLYAIGERIVRWMRPKRS